MAVLLILLGGVLPLLILPGLLMRYDSAPKLLLTEFALAGVLLFHRELRHGLRQLRVWQTGRWLIWLAVAQVAWFGIATGLSVRPAFSLFGSSWRQLGWLTVSLLCLATVIAAATLCLERTQVRRLLRAMAVAGVAAGAYGIAQYFDIDPFQSAAFYHDHAGDSVIVRPPGTMGHADYFGWWLAVEFFCGLALAAVENPVRGGSRATVPQQSPASPRC